MKNSKYSALVTLFHIMSRYNSMWSYASQRKILQLMEKYHGITIKRRMLNYHLADLRSAGYIKTIKRHTRDDEGQIILLPSAHCITLKGYLYLAYKAVGKAWDRVKALRKRYLPKETHPKDLQTPIQEHVEIPQRDGYNPFLDPHYRQARGLAPDFDTFKKTGSID